MIRQVMYKSLTPRPVLYQSCNLAFQQRARYSIIDSAKDMMKKANKKVGEVAADGIDKTEKVAPSTDNVKDAVKTVNKKTGEVLAEGIDKAENITPTKEDVEHAADTVNKKTGKVLADGIDKTEHVAKKAEAKKRVVEHSKGYKDLQDKGSKVEIEQNRPEDGV